MLDDALVLDEQGHKINYSGQTSSQDWDEVQAFCRRVYMPYRVQPLKAGTQPQSTMLSAQAGRITLTRFSYGASTFLDEFDQDSGKILILNTLSGQLKHKSSEGETLTKKGDCFLVDCSQTDYWLQADEHHMQLNLTICPTVMKEIAQRWFGFVPSDTLWSVHSKMGEGSSRWLQLLDYVVKTLHSPMYSCASEKIGHHLEELMCVELLQQWAAIANVDLRKGPSCGLPLYVRKAEEIFDHEAKDMPTVSSVAARVGVSARTLLEGFRRVRGLTPSEFLASKRLDGLRTDLLTRPSHLSIAYIASEWGFVNFGNLAKRYKQRFGELPSRTRACVKRER